MTIAKLFDILHSWPDTYHVRVPTGEVYAVTESPHYPNTVILVPIREVPVTSETAAERV